MIHRFVPGSSGRYERAPSRCDRTDARGGRGKPTGDILKPARTGSVVASIPARTDSSGPRLEMNLYRSFGNLMEAWVTEEGQCSYSELLGDNGEAASSPPSNPRSESVDSGVEMASATSSSVSMDNAELDGFPPERASEPSRLSCPSPPNPFSPCLPPGGARDHSALLHQRVEAALERSHSKHLNNKPECLTAAETHGRHSRAHLRHHAESVRGQRSERPDLRRMFNPSEPMRLTRHRWSSVTSDTLTFQRKLEVRRFLAPNFCLAP